MPGCIVYVSQINLIILHAERVKPMWRGEKTETFYLKLISEIIGNEWHCDGSQMLVAMYSKTSASPKILRRLIWPEVTWGQWQQWRLDIDISFS